LEKKIFKINQLVHPKSKQKAHYEISKKQAIQKLPKSTAHKQQVLIYFSSPSKIYPFTF
jgi:hypothetical protein